MTMTMTNERWRAYWAGRTSPQHARDDEAHYREYATELRLLFPGPAPRRVLEIGCGNGALYPHLGFDRCERYTGVDFSERMLAAFSAAHPDADLVSADGAAYRTDDKFDLIFSSQVAQYWSRSDLAKHLDNATSMLAEAGPIVISGIPWSRMRLAYARGDMTGGSRRPLVRTLLTYGNELVRKRLGEWYDYPELRQLAADRRLRPRFYGSTHYPYRFHASLRPVDVPLSQR